MDDANRGSSPENKQCEALFYASPLASKLMNRLEAIVRFLVERSAILDLQLGAMEASVTRHYGFRSIIEADRHSILKRVAEKLGAVGIHDLERFYTADDGVLLENAVL